MLSPLELENKRILTNKRRYDRYEMDEYLDMVFENYKELFNEYEEQKKQIKTLSEGIQYYRSIESTMQKALLLAEKTSKETKDAAILKAEAIEKDANNKAAKIVGTAEQEYTRIREKCIELVTQFNNYKAQLQVAANEQLRLITSTTFDIETPVIDKDEDVNAAGLEAVGAINHSSVQSEPEQIAPEHVAQEPVVTPEPVVAPESFAQVEEPVQPEPEQIAPEPVAAPESFVQVESPVQPGPEQIASEPVSEQMAFTQVEAPVQPEPQVSPVAQPEPIHFENQSNLETVVEEKPGSSVYSFSASSGNTNPLPDLSGVTATAVSEPEPVSEKTMVLPDVKDVDRASLRPSKTYTEEEQLQILSAETINLDESIKAVKEQEMLEVPKREEPEQLVLDQAAPEAPVGQPKTGLDTILQSMTIGKRKKANGESAEDPFEFLGSVDDF